MKVRESPGRAEEKPISTAGGKTFVPELNSRYLGACQTPLYKDDHWRQPMRSPSGTGPARGCEEGVDVFSDLMFRLTYTIH